MSKERVCGFDLLRAIAIFFVIVIHVDIFKDPVVAEVGVKDEHIKCKKKSI